MTKRSVLVTGATGYIAGLLLPALRERYELRLTDTRSTDRNGQAVDGVIIADLLGASASELASLVAGVDAIVLMARLERRSDPLVERVRRLDVVMAVDEHGGRFRARLHPFGRHDRVVRRLVDRRSLDADSRELVRDPVRGSAHLLGSAGIRRDALDAQELVQLREMLGLVIAEVGDRGIGVGVSVGLARHGRMIGP